MRRHNRRRPDNRIPVPYVRGYWQGTAPLVIGTSSPHVTSPGFGRVTGLAITALCAVGLGLLIGERPEVGLAAIAAAALLAVFLIDLTAGVVSFYALQMILHVFPALAAGVKVFGAVLLLAWFLEILPTVRVRPRASLIKEEPILAGALALFMGYGASSILWTPNLASTIDAIVRFSFNVILMLAVFAAVRDRASVRAILRAITIGGAVTVLLLVASGGHVSGSRLGSESTDANTLALALAPAVLIGVALASVEPSTIWRMIAAISAVIDVVGIFLTDSRGGLVTLAVGLVVWFLFGGRWRFGLAILLTAIVASTSFYFSAVAGPAARERVLAAVGKSNDPSLQSSGRTDIWKVGLRAFRARPLTGGGFGAYTSIAPRYLLTEPGLVRRSDFLVGHPKIAHNLYLHELVEVGILGALPLLLSMLIGAFRYLGAIARFKLQGDSELELLSRALLASTVGVFAGEFFLSGQYAKILWVLVGLGPALVHVTHDRPTD